MALRYQRGAVVYVSQLPDQNGGNPKDRPVAVMADVDESATELFGVAITTEFGKSVPDYAVPLRYQRHSSERCGTGLRKPSVANCNWVVAVRIEDVIDKIGHLSNKELLAIQEKLEARGQEE